MSTYETGTYAMGSFPCYRANGVDTIRTAILGISGTLTAAGWTQTATLAAQGYFTVPIGAPVLNPTPAAHEAPYYYCGICDSLAGNTLYSYFFYDPAHPPTSAQWAAAEAVAPILGVVVQVPLGATSNASLANLIAALVGWTGSLSGSGTTQQLNLVAVTPGVTGNTKLPDMLQGSSWVVPVQPYGGGYAFQSQALPNNKPIRVNVVEQPWRYTNVTAEFQFPDLGVTIDMAQSTAYVMWASPVVFAVFEAQDIQLPPPHPPPEVNAYHRNLFVSQVYIDNSAYPTTVPMQLLISAKTRQGLASVQSELNSTIVTWTPDGIYSTWESNTTINPIWSFYVPRFAETPATLARADGTPIAVDPWIGLTRAAQTPPSRIRGILPDAFVLLADRDLDERIQCSGKTWMAMRAGHFPVAQAGNMPAGTLYVRTN